MAGSVVNFTLGENVSNTAPVAVEQTSGVGDIKVQVSFSSTQVLIRAVGYYSHVHPVPGSHGERHGSSHSLAGITNASATKRYVIKLEPGIFDLGSTRLIMKPYVDIEGSVSVQVFIENSQVRAPGSNSTGAHAPSATVTIDHSEIGSSLSIILSISAVLERRFAQPSLPRLFQVLEGSAPHSSTASQTHVQSTPRIAA